MRDAAALPGMRAWREMLRYGLVGGASLLVYAGASAALAFVMWPGPAAGLAAIASGAINFYGHARYTFRTRRSVVSSLGRYASLVAFNAGLAALIVTILVDALGAPLFVGNVVALGVVTLSSFVLLKAFVMSDPAPGRGASPERDQPRED